MSGADLDTAAREDWEAPVVQAPLIGRATILNAALRVADQHGPDAVSMYAVARQLQVEPTVLHRYVEDTNDLLDGLVEILLTRTRLLAIEGPWDDRILAMARAIRDTAREHPAVFPLLLTRPVITPEAREGRDAVYGALRDSGLPEEVFPRVERLISTAVLGFAASEAAGRFRMHPQEIIDADFAELLRWLMNALYDLGAKAPEDAA